MDNTNIVTWKEVPREYVQSLTNPTIQVLIYNPLTDSYKIESCGKHCIANYKNAYDGLKYYVLVEGY